MISNPSGPPNKATCGSKSMTEAATVLPAQIYTWSGMPEGAYVSLTAAGILVLLTLLITLNATAVILRNRFERRW